MATRAPHRLAARESRRRGHPDVPRLGELAWGCKGRKSTYTAPLAQRNLARRRGYCTVPTSTVLYTWLFTSRKLYGLTYLVLEGRAILTTTLYFCTAHHRNANIQRRPARPPFSLAACYRHARCQAFVAAMRRERRQKAAARPHCARACTRAACWPAHASHAAAHSGGRGARGACAGGLRAAAGLRVGAGRDRGEIAGDRGEIDLAAASARAAGRCDRSRALRRRARAAAAAPSRHACRAARAAAYATRRRKSARRRPRAAWRHRAAPRTRERWRLG